MSALRRRRARPKGHRRLEVRQRPARTTSVRGDHEESSVHLVGASARELGWQRGEKAAVRCGCGRRWSSGGSWTEMARAQERPWRRSVGDLDSGARRPSAAVESPEKEALIAGLQLRNTTKVEREGRGERGGWRGEEEGRRVTRFRQREPHQSGGSVMRWRYWR